MVVDMRICIGSPANSDALAPIDLVANADRTVPIDVVIGREMTQRSRYADRVF